MKNENNNCYSAKELDDMQAGMEIDYKILQSLIDSSKLQRDVGRVTDKNGNCWIPCDGIDFIKDANLFLVLQQALFDACAERGIVLQVVNNKLNLSGSAVFRDTTHKSWVAAYKKVMGIEV